MRLDSIFYVHYIAFLLPYSPVVSVGKRKEKSRKNVSKAGQATNHPLFLARFISLWNTVLTRP